MEVIHNAPTHESFIPLSTHQSQTPESFFSGPPVLYHHTAAATLRVQANELASAPALKTLFEDAQPSTNDAPTTNGHAHGEEDEREMEVKGVDIWVSSEYRLFPSIVTDCLTDVIVQTVHTFLRHQAGWPIDSLPIDLSTCPPTIHSALALPPACHRVFHF